MSIVATNERDAGIPIRLPQRSAFELAQLIDARPWVPIDQT